MKRKFSLNSLLHNDRFIIAFSLVAAIAVWALVSFGPGNITTRELSVPVSVDLTNTMAGYNDLRVIGENTFTVNVEVEGTRSVVFNLNAEDISVKPALSEIQGAGKTKLSLTASKAGKSTNYEIISISPSHITVECDYWTAATFPVATDISQLSLEDEQTQQLGDVILDTTVLPDGIVQIEGPRSVINTITSVVAKVDTKETISKTKRYEASLLALDSKGAEVDLTNCNFVNVTDNKVALTVPVWVQKSVDLTYQLAHVPSGIAPQNLVSLSTKTITLVGEYDVLESIASTVGNLGMFDFDHIKPDEADIVVTLNVPAGVKVLEGNAVTVHLNIDTYKQKTVVYPVEGTADVTVENLPAGKTITLQSQKLSDIVVCGKEDILRKLTANDLQLILDASSNTGTGSVRYTVRIQVPKYPDVWVYYGSDDQSPYVLYGTLE